MAQIASLSDLSLGSAERLDGTPVTDSAVIYAGEIAIMFDGEGSDVLAASVARAAHAHEALVAAVTLLDSFWAEDDPDGPDSASFQGKYTAETAEVWRAARAALAKAEA
jgi:hypothetical protein